MRISKKLVLLVTVPVAAVVVFAALALLPTGRDALQADRLRDLVATSTAAGELIHQLQDERAAAVLALVDGSEETETAYRDQNEVTDGAIDKYEEVRGELTGLPESAEDRLNRIDAQLERLADLRDQALGREQTASAAAFAYRITIAELLSYRDTIAQAGEAPVDIANWLRAASALSEAAEHMSLQQVAVVRAAGASEDLTPMAFQEIASARAAHTDAMLSFAALAKPEWLTAVEAERVGGEDAAADPDDEDAQTSVTLRAQLLEDQVARVSPNEEITVDVQEWNLAVGARVAMLMGVANDVDQDVTADVTTLRDEQRNFTIGQAIGIVLAVAVTVLLAVWLGSPVIRGLRRLRDSARRVAHEDLPTAVRELDENEDLGGLTPGEFADRTTPPLQTKGKGTDELSEVAEAFNDVHREAIRVAAQQALLRVHVGAMFVRLARRGHSLAGRLTATLDEAERDEQDPDRLQRLFRLDHLVSLLGRANDSLLVLGGASAAKVRTSDEKLGDVLTAAQSHTEHYTRINISMVDDGVWINAEVIDDVVQLLAELMDNATRYSETPAEVIARFLTDRVVIQVRDFGIGVEPSRMARYNARLGARAPLDLEAMQAMGLTVVGHLAIRHGIHVQLRDAADRGTIAEVTLPRSMLSFASNPDSNRRGPAAVTAGPAGAPPPREAPLFQ
ncbi:MAG: sensor histidine kinase, partial [Stackebrandtia sp.]